MILFIIVCLFLILLVLIQKGRGGGLASAFGGAGGNTAFGSKTGDVLTWATSIVFGIFLVLAIVLNLMANVAAHRQTSPSRSAAARRGAGRRPLLRTTARGRRTHPTTSPRHARRARATPATHDDPDRIEHANHAA